MKISVILGSTRPGRVGERVAKWVMAGLESTPGVEAELIDLAEFDLPHFDEELPPRGNRDRHPQPGVARYLRKLEDAEGVIIVTPEYNFSFPGVLKDALDFVAFEMHRKPVAIVSYGVVGGSRASQALKLAVNGTKAVVIPEAIAIVAPQDVIDVYGKFVGDTSNPYNLESSLAATIKELVWWAEIVSSATRASKTHA